RRGSLWGGRVVRLSVAPAGGGDAGRVYGVSRGGRSPWRVLLAPLQERLVGLGVTTGAGLAATLCYLPLLPPSLRWLVLPVQLGGLLAGGGPAFPGGAPSPGPRPG